MGSVKLDAVKPGLLGPHCGIGEILPDPTQFGDREGSRRNFHSNADRRGGFALKSRQCQDLCSAVEELQKGEQEMAGKRLGEAENHFRNALRQSPNDYAGLVMMAACQLAQKKLAEGLRYSEAAKAVYPQEAQAHHLSGYAKLQTRDYAGAYQDFSSYEKILPGNPNAAFLKGFSLEGMGNKAEAAKEYHRYLQVVQEGKFAQYAYGRLVEWGYYKR